MKKYYVLIMILSLLLLLNNCFAISIEDYATENGFTGNETDITIRYANIDSLEGLANNYPSLKWLNLVYNNITSIGQGDFSGLTRVQRIYLTGNKVGQISDNAFSGLYSISHLYLTENSLENVNLNMFAGLHQLDVLSLAKNNINNIENGSFRELVNLTNLDLSENDLNSIKSTTFEGMINLKYLSLKNNNINILESNLFENNSNLESVILSDCKIEYISDSVFSNLGNINHLTFANNYNLSSLNLEGADFSSLAWFDVSNCPISSVILKNSKLNQLSFDTIMIGNEPNPRITSIAEFDNVIEMDMSGIDFSMINDFSKMYSMDDLETLLLDDSYNISGESILGIINELDSLSCLSIGNDLWGSLSPDIQSQLQQWSEIPDNVLLVPEPTSLLLLGLGGLLLKRKN